MTCLLVPVSTVSARQIFTHHIDLSRIFGGKVERPLTATKSLHWIVPFLRRLWGSLALVWNPAHWRRSGAQGGVERRGRSPYRRKPRPVYAQKYP